MLQRLVIHTVESDPGFFARPRQGFIESAERFIIFYDELTLVRQILVLFCKDDCSKTVVMIRIKDVFSEKAALDQICFRNEEDIIRLRELVFLAL